MTTNVMRIGHLLQRSVLRSVHSVLSVSTFNVQPRNGTSPASTVLFRSVLLHGLVFLINTFPCLLYPSLDQRQPHSYSYNITAARHISFAKMPAAAFASCEVRNSMRCLPDPSSPLLSLSSCQLPEQFSTLSSPRRPPPLPPPSVPYSTATHTQRQLTSTKTTSPSPILHSSAHVSSGPTTFEPGGSRFVYDHAHAALEARLFYPPRPSSSRLQLRFPRQRGHLEPFFACLPQLGGALPHDVVINTSVHDDPCLPRRTADAPSLRAQ